MIPPRISHCIYWNTRICTLHWIKTHSTAHFSAIKYKFFLFVPQILYWYCSAQCTLLYCYCTAELHYNNIVENRVHSRMVFPLSQEWMRPRKRNKCSLPRPTPLDWYKQWKVRRGFLEKFALGRFRGNQIFPKGCTPWKSLITRGTSCEQIFQTTPEEFPLFVRLWASKIKGSVNKWRLAISYNDPSLTNINQTLHCLYTV